MTRLDCNGHQEDASPCGDCGVLTLPQRTEQCDCTTYLCDDCYEDRVCCGENAPADCPECGDSAVVTLDKASKLWAVACTCCDCSVEGSKLRSVAIDRWDAAAAVPTAHYVALHSMQVPPPAEIFPITDWSGAVVDAVAVTDASGEPVVIDMDPEVAA